MILAFIALVKMLKRRASKRFVLESGDEPQSSSSSSGMANTNDNGPIQIPHIVAIDQCNHDDNTYNSSSNNNNEINDSSPTTSTSLLSVQNAGTLK